MSREKIKLFGVKRQGHHPGGKRKGRIERPRLLGPRG